MRPLSNNATAKLTKIGRARTRDTIESLGSLMIKHGMVPFAPVIETFLHFGGYVLPFAPEGRFKIYRLKAAIQAMTRDSKSTDPLTFKMPFGESETIQSYYWINGLGHLYEDDTTNLFTIFGNSSYCEQD